MELRMYTYRLYPSHKQKNTLIDFLKTCKLIYNELLALKIDAWTFGKVSLSRFDCNDYLVGRYNNIYAQSRENVADRVHKAFQNFFRRVKDPSVPKGKKGFPRFKSRVDSITYPQYGFKILSDKLLKVTKIGSIPIILHRIPKGKIKTLTIKQNRVGQWFAIFVCERPQTITLPPPSEKIGIDVGIEYFATLSNGEVIDNPSYLARSKKRLKLLHRRVSRKIKGSNNRRKARFKLAKHYLGIVNRRSDFQHKLSNVLVRKYRVIAVENLNIENMLKNRLVAKSVTDASWSTFINMLSYKAVTCGGQVLKNPKTRGSSHRCSRCGRYVDMPLSKRKFSCPKCGFSCHRDLNASINHLNDTVGTDCSKPNACEHNVRPTSLAVVDETGTIYGNS